MKERQKLHIGIFWTQLQNLLKNVSLRFSEALSENLKDTLLFCWRLIKVFEFILN